MTHGVVLPAKRGRDRPDRVSPPNTSGNHRRSKKKTGKSGQHLVFLPLATINHNTKKKNPQPKECFRARPAEKRASTSSPGPRKEKQAMKKRGTRTLQIAIDTIHTIFTSTRGDTTLLLLNGACRSRVMQRQSESIISPPVASLMIRTS